jgi:hypothetical protein
MSKIHQLASLWRKRQTPGGTGKRPRQTDFILENCALELNSAIDELTKKWLERAESEEGISAEAREEIYACLKDLTGKEMPRRTRKP